MIHRLRLSYARYASLLIATSLMLTLPATAQAEAGSRALAVQLFDEAEVLNEKGQVAEACPKYAESYRLDPQLGVLMYLAECYEKNGQLASAWGSYREAEEIGRRRGDERADQARERATTLEPRVSYLSVKVPQTARLPGLEVLRDGALISEVLWGGRAAVDAGKHRIEVRAPGYKPWQHEVVVVDETSTATVEVPKLQADPAAPRDPGSVVARNTSSHGAAQRIAALAVGGLGVVGVGIGGFFGLSAQASLSDSKDLCSEKNYCTAKGDEFRSSAKSKALVATIATGAGAAALTTAAVLWFTAPKVEPFPTGLRAPAKRRAWAVSPTNNAWGMEMSHAF